MRPLLVLLAATACGGGQPQVTAPVAEAPPPTPPPVPTASCERTPGPPLPAGRRRVQLELDANPGAVEVSVDGRPSASARDGRACVTFDVGPGPHEVALHATGVTLGTKLAIENAKGPWWYDVFSLACDPCTRQQLADWGRAAQSDRRRLTDPCSAAQVRNIRWDSERPPGSERVIGLTLSFVLFLYDAPFDLPPRDPSCPEN